MAALGGVLFFVLLKNREKQMGLLKDEHYWLLVNVLAVSAFLGARLFYIIFSAPPGTPEFGAAVFAVNRGFSAFGFFSGILAGSWFFTRALKLDFLRFFDYVCAFLPVWQIFARFGCFMRGCCYGRPAGDSLAWSVTFTDFGASVPRELLGLPLHPVQLYEAAGSAVLALALYSVLLRTENGRLGKGAVCASYLLGYGLLRFALEWFRGDTLPFWRFITVGQAMASVLAVLGAVFLTLALKKARVKADGRD